MDVRVGTLRVTVSTRVAAPPAEAFALFTGEIGAWWAAGARDGARFRGALRFEPGVGGRLLKSIGDQAFEIGRVQRWEPPGCFVFECREPGDENGPCTEVEVRFAGAAGGTRVTLEHRGFERLPADHPARAGLGSEALLRLWGRCWSERLEHARECAVRARSKR
jgi:uncharacterized protein YndB with AHSA1/START domain